MNKHICYLGNAASIHVLRWAAYFAEIGWKVDLITWRAPKMNRELLQNVNVHRLIFPAFSVARWGALIEVIWHIWSIRPDIIHAHYINTFGILAALYSRVTNFHPVVLSVWGPYGLLHSRGFQRKLIHFALKRADVVTTTSSYLRDILISEFHIGGDRVIAFPWGIDLQIFHQIQASELNDCRAELGITEDDYVVLSPRHMEPHYNISAIVHAFALVAVKYPEVVLLLLRGTAKTGRYTREIERLIEKEGLSAKVKIVDRELNPREMALIYNISDVMVSIPKADQFGSTILEGMACGTIPIVSNLEVYRKHLVDNRNAFFVDPEDPALIGEKILHCVVHPELKEAFYKINKKITDGQEDWTINAQKMEKLYMSLLINKLENTV